jgi:peroxiredoxin
MIEFGNPAPFFAGRSNVNPKFHFGTVAGRYMVLSFIDSSSDETGQRFLDAIGRHTQRFDVDNFFFFGVTTDKFENASPRLKEQRPGVVYFFDEDRSISQLYGLAEGNAASQRVTLLLDQGIRVLSVIPWTGSPEEHVAAIIKAMDQCPSLNPQMSSAPVLCIDNIFERDFCRLLINLYLQTGGTDSGFMRDVQGKTTSIMDYGHKRRMDYEITDQKVIEAAHIKMRQRLLPELKKAFQYTPTRIERNIVACYDSSVGGHFRAHRDNTTKGTAHRQFAVSINLNTEEFEGGQLWFPEFGRRTYRPSTGGAVVFSCSLLHEARPVTKGLRYAYLPFLYNEEGARIRQANLQFLAKKEG